MNKIIFIFLISFFFLLSFDTFPKETHLVCEFNKSTLQKNNKFSDEIINETILLKFDPDFNMGYLGMGDHKYPLILTPEEIWAFDLVENIKPGNYVGGIPYMYGVEVEGEFYKVLRHDIYR